MVPIMGSSSSMLNSFLIVLPFNSRLNSLKSTPFIIVLILASVFAPFVNLFLTALELQIILSGKNEKILKNIPEKIRKARDVFRYHLNQLGFYEFQKSVFVHPYNCKDEIDYLIEFYNLRRFVRFVEADSIDNELHLKKYFHLLEKADR